MVTASRATLRGGAVRWLLHEIRNPLQVVSMTAELLEGDDPASSADLLRMLRGGVAQLSAGFHVLDQILERPPILQAAQPVSLTEVLRFITELYGYDREPGAIRIAGDPGELPAVQGMRTRLSHALLNVVQNGKEAVARQQDGVVTVLGELDGDAVRISVTDNGSGVLPAIQGTMFEPFVTSKSVSAMSGLGLPVARWLAEQFGGSLVHDAEAASGTRFVFRFPVWRG